MKSTLRLDKLARDLRVRRAELHLGQREVARAIGVSASTLCRVENGVGCDLETFSRLCRWMDKRPSSYLGLRS